MEVKIRIFRGPLSEIVGQSETTVHAESHAKIIDVLRLLADKYGSPFKDHVFNSKTNDVGSYLLLSLDGVNVRGVKGRLERKSKMSASF